MTPLHSATMDLTDSSEETRENNICFFLLSISILNLSMTLQPHLPARCADGGSDELAVGRTAHAHRPK